MGLSLHRGQRQDARPARRQGRGRGRDDQRRPAGAARLHHHHRGLQRLLRTTASSSPTACGSRRWRRCATWSSRPARRFGDADNPLLVSVRSGAKFSMPGMMDTVLNLGLNDETVQGLIALSGDERFAYDAYRRFIQMFSQDRARTPSPTPSSTSIERIQASETGATTDAEIPADALKQHGRATSSRSRATPPAAPFPEDPYEQLRLAIEAVFASWNNKRAIDYRNFNKIPHDLGTAVNVQTMVFGNMGDDSGTGVAFTRNPSTGENAALRRLPGERAGRGRGGRHPQHRRRSPHWQTEMPAVYEQFQEIAQRLEQHYRDVQDLEFTIEQGRLYMLQTRSAKRTAAAAVKIAVDMVSEGLITEDEAVQRVEPEQVEQLLLPRFDEAAIEAGARARGAMLAQGRERLAGRGGRQGRLRRRPRRGGGQGGRARSSWCARRPAPTTCTACWSRKGILTSRGGTGSHAAVVARGLGLPARRRLRGASAWTTSSASSASTATGTVVREGDDDLDRRHDRRGLSRARSRPSSPTSTRRHDLQHAAGLGRQDAHGWASGPTPTTRATPQRAVDLRRGGHRPLPHRAHVHGAGAPADRAGDDPGADAQRSARPRSTSCCPSSAPTSRASSARCVDPKTGEGYPVVIRLIDPPLHEFLPSYEELLVEVTRLEDQRQGPERNWTRSASCCRRWRACARRTRCWGCAAAAWGCSSPRST